MAHQHVSVFRGGFALAFYDAKAETLLLARDHFGQKPLYYVQVGDEFFFASEIQSLLSIGVVPELDQESLSVLLRLQFLPPGRSLLRGVKALRPGEMLELKRRAGGLVLRSSTTSWPVNDLAVAEAFQISCARQARTEVPTAMLLSGGLDSTAVAMGLAQTASLPSTAWVGHYPEGPKEWDERSYASPRCLGGRLAFAKSFPIYAEDFAEAMPEVLRRLEEPIAGPGAVAQLLLCRSISEREGARVLFGGQGGDELFGGYERLRILQDLEAGASEPRDPAYWALVQTHGPSFRASILRAVCSLSGCGRSQ